MTLEGYWERAYWRVVPQLAESLVKAAEARDLAEERLSGIREAVEALPKWDKRSVPGGFHVNRAAVLAIIDGEQP
jgi:hypothetical protein